MCNDTELPFIIQRKKFKDNKDKEVQRVGRTLELKPLGGGSGVEHIKPKGKCTMMCGIIRKPLTRLVTQLGD